MTLVDFGCMPNDAHEASKWSSQTSLDLSQFSVKCGYDIGQESALFSTLRTKYKKVSLT